MIFSQNNILVVLASYNSKLKENKLKSLKFINIYSLHTYKFKSKINMKNLVNNFEKKSFFYLSYIDLKVYLKHLKCLKYKYKPRIKNRRISYKRKYISVVENKIHKLFIKKYRKKRIKFMSKKNKRKKKYKLRFLLKKFKIKTKFKFIKSSKKRFVKKRFVKKKFVKKKFVKKKIYKKFYKRKVKLTKLSIRNRLNLKKKVKKKLFFSRKFFQKKFSSLNSLKNNFLKFKKNLLYVNFFIQFKLIKLVESLLKNKKIKKYNIKINKFLSFWINYKKALKYKQVLNNLKNFKKSLKKTFFTKCFLKKRFKKSYKLKLTVRRLKKYFKKKKLRKSKYFDKVGLEIINTLKTKIKFQQNFLETFKYSKVFFKYTGSNIFATITTKLGNVLYSYSSGFFKGLCTRKEKTTIFVSKQLGELISMRLYRLNAKEVFFVPLINHKRSRTLIKYMIYGFRLTHSFKIGTIEVKLNVMRNGVRLRKVPRK